MPASGLIIKVIPDMELQGKIVTYLISGTATGRKIKGAVRDGVKYGYDGIASGAKKGYEKAKQIGSKISKGFSSTFKKLGGLFGGLSTNC
ncbi:hypothetical protein AN964_18435 [Heyndrickxia shackletonii]|uniref:Uncharacterized protein n=1 Tax=Heyndrickxia shackletonii TaxID=157838 RepID=A0A0Q3WSK9_9BACI|nr:hypothetical protein [Heyndrickxia shackletonii]KQL51007.1 hypothetical protein AN964_18435 [Heyndrickxia shackletonii]MBB2481874.1 hypothetical protein [Bacillus sp. APMAM]NEZ02013.1 hypothetical protein [Heyndrickxia shackletonii]RTZ54799.1 hypothetical protein EKO25_16225 [Bacillus sp. SAJ1]